MGYYLPRDICWYIFEFLIDCRRMEDLLFNTERPEYIIETPKKWYLDFYGCSYHGVAINQLQKSMEFLRRNYEILKNIPIGGEYDNSLEDILLISQSEQQNNDHCDPCTFNTPNAFDTLFISQSNQSTVRSKRSSSH